MTTPDKILELIDAFRRSKTMFAAVKLGIFDGLRPADCKELPRLLDACVALGLLEKRDGAYVNTP
jgi:acetylserotonin N-methyltransferase